jgi:hypothetical protein
VIPGGTNIYPARSAHNAIASTTACSDPAFHCQRRDSLLTRRVVGAFEELKNQPDSERQALYQFMTLSASF